ncbi:MAG: hypothetical protein JXA52_09445 [Planctomycetes bacterium]|nr:hypothetical protein [Planctomycetota bacterium]
MIQILVFYLVIALILIFAAFLWILYLIKLVTNEEELNEKIRSRQRRREEERRQKNDNRKQLEDKKKRVRPGNEATDATRSQEAALGREDNPNDR